MTKHQALWGRRILMPHRFGQLGGDADRGSRCGSAGPTALVTGPCRLFEAACRGQRSQVVRGWYDDDDDGNLLPGAPGGPSAWATNSVEGSGSITGCSLPDDDAAAHQCWLCGKLGRVAADDGFGWSWVPADGGAWYHCDGCGVSWRPGGLTGVADGGQTADGAPSSGNPAADHGSLLPAAGSCCRSASPAGFPGPELHRT